MALVKFVKSVKYNGLRHEAHTPFEVKDLDVALLKTQGAIILSHTGAELSETEDSNPKSVELPQEQSSDTDNSELKSKLVNYSLNELIKFAKENSIDLKGKTKKADVYNVIVSSL